MANTAHLKPKKYIQNLLTMSKDKNERNHVPKKIERKSLQLFSTAVVR